MGDIKFRLGWAHVRSQNDVQKGLILLEEASNLLPDNVEVLMKMAGAFFMEMSDLDQFETSKKIMKAVDRVCELEPNNCVEALILKGKLLHKKEEYKNAI